MSITDQYDIGTPECHIVKAECIVCGYSVTDPSHLETWNAYGGCPDHGMHPIAEPFDRTLWIMSDHTASYLEHDGLGEEQTRIEIDLDMLYRDHLCSATMWTMLTLNMRSLTPAASSVQALIRKLIDAGVEGVIWQHTGGGCFAIEVPLPHHEGRDYLYITDRWDVLSHSDFESDEDRQGWSMGRYVWLDSEDYAHGEREVVVGGRDVIYATDNLSALDTIVSVVRTEIATNVEPNRCERCPFDKASTGTPNRVTDGRLVVLCESCHANG
ncbi:MAG: hypothetical protein ACRDQD_11855 [Nocardioidaceae bacterium]